MLSDLRSSEYRHSNVRVQLTSLIKNARSIQHHGALLSASFFLIAMAPLVTTALRPNRLQEASDRGDLGGIQALISSTNQTVASVVWPFVALGVLASTLLLVLPLVLRIPITFALPGLAFFFGSLILATVHGDLSVGRVIIPSVLVLVFTSYVLNFPSAAWATAQAVVATYIVASWFAAIFAPTAAVEFGYVDSLVESVPLRLHGLAPHANALGAIAACGVVLSVPGRARPALAAASISTLLATQSKTAIAALLMASLLWLILRRAPRKIIAAAFAAMAVLGPLFAWIAYVRRNDSEPLGVFGSLTGRTLVWDVSISRIDGHVLTGAGPTFWNYEMRVEYLPTLGFAPGQAHNQFLQSLGTGGLVNLACFAVTIFVLVAACISQRPQVHFAAPVMVAMLLIRSITESVIPTDISDGNVAVLLLVLVACYSKIGAPGRDGLAVEVRSQTERGPFTWRRA